MASSASKRQVSPESAPQHLPAVYVHAGAGFHSVQNENIHLQACANAARVAMACLKEGGNAIDAVELAIKSLEDNEVTNAGYGSNLTIEGVVEGDATIVDHYGRSGAVGAISNVANPIHAARVVYENSIRPMSLRRVPPNLLVGPGAVEFARESGISILPNGVLVSRGAEERYRRWASDIQRVESENESSRSPLPSPTRINSMVQTTLPTPSSLSQPSLASPRAASQSSLVGQNSASRASHSSLHSIPSPWKDKITDTVGAIAVDCNGNFAAASSSGGIGMKHTGRVGPAALVNIGTAVIPVEDNNYTTVACVTSGTGEHMATTTAARTCAERVYHSVKRGGLELTSCHEEEALHSFVKNDFMGHPSVVHSTTGGAIGAMVVKKDLDGMWLYFVHNTDSFALASMHAHDNEPNTVMSRNKKQNSIATGGRAMRAEQARKRTRWLD